MVSSKGIQCNIQKSIRTKKMKDIGYCLIQSPNHTIFLRAFTSSFLFFSYFTSSKPTLFTLPLNIYNIPHIPLFILHYTLLKYYTTISFFFSLSRYTSLGKTKPTSQPHTVHAGETKPNIPTTYSELNHHHSHKTTTKSNHPSKLPLNPPQTKLPHHQNRNPPQTQTHCRPKPTTI